MRTNHLLQIVREKKTSPIVFLVLMVLLGSFIRFIQVLSLDFPLNDGGAFYQMIHDLRAAGYALPEFTSYNQANIPFSYPPLPFYIAAFLQDLFNLDLLDILRIIPATISILTIPAFYSLARKIFQNQEITYFATFAFTFLPTSFDWLVVGGGLSRSFGFLFAILFLCQFYTLLLHGGRKPLVLGIVFAALTLLSHPGTAFFACYGSLVILLFHIKVSKKWLQKTALVGSGTLILASPWWLQVIINHGLGVFLHPFQTENPSLASLFTPFTFIFTNEPLLDILAFLGMIGVFICLRKRAYFLPAWLFITFFFESRLGATYAVVPMSLLVGIGIVEGFLPILVKPQDQGSQSKPGWVSALAFVFLTFYVILNAYLGVNYQVVTKNQREAMQWIAENTPKGSQFLVLSGISAYGVDPVSEWFPTLSQRHSLTTPQLHEWLPNQEFSHRIELHAELQACSDQDFHCIETWADQRLISFSHIYITNPEYFCYGDTDRSDYLLLYNQAGGMIWSRR